MGGALGLSHGPGPMGQAHLGGAQLAAPADAAFEDDKDAAETVKSARGVLAGFYKDNDLVLLQKATACENPWHFAYNYVNTVFFVAQECSNMVRLALPRNLPRSLRILGVCEPSWGAATFGGQISTPQ